MRAAFVVSQSAEDPLAGLRIGEQSEPKAGPGLEILDVKAATVNRHDLWSLHGPPPAPEHLPMILGTDAAGVAADGRRVVAYPVLGDYASGRWRLPSEESPGTMAERVALPTKNLVDLPPELSFEEAACLPTAYLTAYRMLFTCGGLGPGQRVMVQGATGGVATAAIILAKAAGIEIYASARTEQGADLARSLGADVVVEAGARLPHRVDAVVETVGSPTWEHTWKVVRNGGRIIVAGATAGKAVELDLERLYLRQVAVIGTSMGTRDEFEGLIRFMVATGARPLIGARVTLDDGLEDAFRALHESIANGKIVVLPQRTHKAEQPTPMAVRDGAGG